MDLILIAAIVLLAFEAVYNAWEFFVVYRSRKDKAKMMEAHSQIGEGSELVAFVLAGILLARAQIIDYCRSLFCAPKYVNPTILINQKYRY